MGMVVVVVMIMVVVAVAAAASEARRSGVCNWREMAQCRPVLQKNYEDLDDREILLPAILERYEERDDSFPSRVDQENDWVYLLEILRGSHGEIDLNLLLYFDTLT